ncbi:methyl-accepting chemotaxis sensory transducer with Cache sensor [Candidatus Vecturithrix granuli]|uniref:Methyl-accepting chemotaxis sensory transducer with Cache sensor n=1 Tax=Vecturithrix granuli TaxID=1499967 RepID=A0A081C5Y7_VECG1|nr:methyl-accepting chemotaxis sensory transducer with Cache sensor [Candidatus Vecturithrix granuli]
MKLSLKNKFLLPTLALLIGGMGASMLIAYINARNTLDTAIRSQITQMVTSINDNLNAWMTRSQLDLEVWSTMKVYQTALQDTFAGKAAQKAASNELATLRDKYQFYESLSVVNLMGEIVASSASDIVGTLNVAEYSAFQEAIQGKNILSEVIPGARGNPICMAAAPLKDRETTIGVLLGIIDLAYLGQMYIEPVKVGQTGYAYMFDRNGQMIAFPDKTQVLKLNLNDQNFGREFLETPNGVIMYTWEGSAKLAAFQRSELTGWTVVVAADHQEIFAPIQTMRMVSFTVAGVVILLTAIIILVLVRSIVQPITKGVQFARSIAEGDLTANIEIIQRDEIGMLMDALREMISHLRDMVLNVKQAAGNVTESSQALSLSAAQMSQGATEQAAATEEASASIEQMLATIRQNADNAVQTEKIALKAAEDARDSGHAVIEAVNAMQEIAEKIAIIETITNQTRMLSLNATIEATKAQEYGRGFAVVAGEVRALAERSQQATAEITKLVGSSVSIAENAGVMLKQLVPDIQKTAELVQEISAASREQNAGAEQINRAILQLDQVTQQNAVTSEEIAGRAEDLSSQARQLQKTMASFKTEKNESHTEELEAMVRDLTLQAEQLQKIIALKKAEEKQEREKTGETTFAGRTSQVPLLPETRTVTEHESPLEPRIPKEKPTPEYRANFTERLGDIRDKEFERY